MTPSARVQAAIDILDEVIVAARDEGPPADVVVQRYFKARRYAGSKDRRAVRDLVYRAIRRAADRPATGRAAMLGLAGDDPALLDLFDGSSHGPERVAAAEQAAPAGLVPAWLERELSPLVGAGERAALLDRAPLDLRVNVALASREAVLAELDGAAATPLSPWGVRISAEARIDDHPAYREGRVEVQDEGSQLIALACHPGQGQRIIDLCAGAGGKALALAAAAPHAEIIACDTHRARLARLAPRAERAGAAISTRLLDGGREAERLADLEGTADVVLVDAPCSGSGTWRRNPEARWRLTAQRLDRLVALQSRLIDIAATLVKPGGSLVYATCSLLHREGAERALDFLGRHSSWSAQDALVGMGRRDGPGILLTPGHDRTDGFFVARLVRSC